MAGEQNELYYIPLGVGVVIPPWNFPLAILGGMTLASVVAGNTVVLKPSSESAVVAARFVELDKDRLRNPRQLDNRCVADEVKRGFERAIAEGHVGP